LADLAFDGLRSYLKEKLEGFECHTVNYLQIKVLGLEFRLQSAKDAHNTHRSIHIDSKYDSDDEKKEVAEFIWPSEAKPCSCSSLKPIPKNRQEQASFTFDVSKCDRIFDELLRSGNIKLSHVIPPLEELKQHAYCKWHNTFSHATNDCNIFCRKIQSAVNKGRLAMHEVKDDKASFPVHTIDLDKTKVLIRPEQAEGAKEKKILSLVSQGRKISMTRFGLGK